MADSIVIGAGMVGVSTALALQERGHSVVLVDRRGPGEETSYGNAGVIQAEAVEPYAVPLAPKALLGILFGTSPDVVYSLKAMPAWLPPTLRYMLHSTPRRYARIVPHYARLIVRATADHDRFIAAAGAQELIDRTGFLQAYRHADGLDEALHEAERVKASYGVPSAYLSGDELAAAEPGLLQRMAGAVLWTGVWSCRDPGGLVARYAALFSARGGTIATGDASSLNRTAAGWQIDTGNGRVDAARAVVALGPWSPTLLSRFGYRIPMVLKRGYHQHFSSSKPPTRPFMDVANATVMSPMTRGLRVLTGAELNTIDAPSNLRQIERSVAAAGTLFDLGSSVEAVPWRGARPCMPDMLPVIGQSRRDPALWFNFGHGHQGFTLGPTSGTLLAEVMTGNADPQILAPYARY